MHKRLRLSAALVVLMHGVCAGAQPGKPSLIDNTALSDTRDGRNWPAYGRGFDEQHYSPLTQIDRQTVKRLRLAATYDLAGFTHTATAPVAVDGVIYLVAGFSVVHAIEARSGRLLWRHDPEVAPRLGTKMRSAWAGVRGLTYWNGRIYVGTYDGRLLALDAETGKEVWSAQTTEPGDARYITGAPRVFNGKVIIGHGGGDYGTTRGYVTAYDADTGRQLWRFYTVPGDPGKGFENKAMEMAAKTWNGEWWKYGGGGTAWNSITYDPEFNRVYVGTGNGNPWNQRIRSPGGGDNLFLSSVVALDADTGEYVWHYQTTPGESWDYNSAMDIELATLKIDGEVRKVILHAPKNGFFYVIDRATGKLISAEKIGKIDWAERVDMATGRPVETPLARYPDGGRLVWPGSMGVHNWQPMAFNPLTGLTYIPIIELPGWYDDSGITRANFPPQPPESFSSGTHIINPKPPGQGHSKLLAWDAAAQRPAWEVPLSGSSNGGVLATAGGLLFQGLADGHFVAYDAVTGEELWRFAAGSAVVAPPIAFSDRGREYIAVISGHNGGASLWNAGQFGWQARTQSKKLLVFALDGTARLGPVVPPQTVRPVDVPGFALDAERVRAGDSIYTLNCQGCHGPGAVAAGVGPDLRASRLAADPEAFAAFLRSGALQSKGMPKFDDLTQKEINAIQHYLRKRAREDLAVQK